MDNNKMTIEEFIQEHNYQCNGAEEQGDEVLFILKSLLTNSFKIYCGEVPNFDFINNKGQIALINEKVKIGNVDLGPEYEDEKNQELLDNEKED